jgi:hypothetical protein
MPEDSQPTPVNAEPPASGRELLLLIDKLPREQAIELLRRHWQLIRRRDPEGKIEAVYDRLVVQMSPRYNPFRRLNPVEIERRMALTNEPREVVFQEMGDGVKGRFGIIPGDHDWPSYPSEEQEELIVKLSKEGPESAYWNEVRSSLTESGWRFLLWWGIVRYYFPVDAR